jgi:transposase
MRAAKSFEKVFLHRGPVDMRKGINGLCDLVSQAEMGQLSGANLFVFTGRKRDSIKILYFDKSGFCLWQKRLEKDRFPWPKHLSDEIVQLTSEQLEWLITGYNVWQMKPFSEYKFERVS